MGMNILVIACECACAGACACVRSGAWPPTPPGRGWSSLVSGAEILTNAGPRHRLVEGEARWCRGLNYSPVHATAMRVKYRDVIR